MKVFIADKLDSLAREQLGAVLRDQVESGVTVILSSHDMTLVRRVADCFLFLSRGQIVQKGQVAELENCARQVQEGARE